MSNNEFNKLIADVEKMVNVASKQFSNSGKLESKSIQTLLIASLIEEEFNNGQEGK